MISVILIGGLPNPRIYKRIALEKEFSDVHLICWDRGTSKLPYPNEDGYKAYVIKEKATNDPLRRLLPYQRFSKQVEKLLAVIKPDIVHVQGLDMLRVVVKYKRHTANAPRIIYEVADLHRLLMDHPRTPVQWAAQRILRQEDVRLSKEYDLLVVTSKKYYETYFSAFVQQKKVQYMPNIPNMNALASYQKKDACENFTIGYIGAIRYKEQIKNLIAAARICDVRLMIAGFETGGNEIEQLCRNSPNIEWVGQFDFNASAAQLYGKCDAMYSVYNADMNNVRVALPNKLYEAIYCKMPLIVAKGTYLAELVDSWGIGVSVDHKSIDELVSSIMRLKNEKALRDEIANNCTQMSAEIDGQKYANQLRNRIFAMLE